MSWLCKSIRQRGWGRRILWSKTSLGYTFKLGSMPKPIIPTTQEVEIKRVTVPSQPGQKVYKIPSQRMIGYSCVCLSPQLYREAQIRGLQSRPAQTYSKILLQKINNAKRTGWVAQVVEHLPSKHKALSSTPSTTKKKKRRRVIHGLFLWGKRLMWMHECGQKIEQFS
jgi:hypothetical protein